jgi:hypothetical protein
MQRVSTNEAAEMLACEGVTPFQRRGRIQRWVAAGIIPPLGSQGRVGEAGRPAWLFDRRTVICAAVLFAVYDHTGFRDPAMLRRLHEHLTGPSAPDGPPLIDAIMEDVAGNGTPFLACIHWAALNQPSVTSFAVRLSNERDGVDAPSAEHVSMIVSTIKLAPVLQRFVGNADNVVPLRKDAK